MKTVSVFELATGIFSGQIICACLDVISVNIPDGYSYVDGAHDHRRRRVDVATGNVVPYQPPAPADSPLCVHRWCPEREEWIPEPTAAAIEADAMAERARRLADTDWVVIKAMDLDMDVPSKWRIYRKALRDVVKQPGWPSTVEWPALPG